jgi:hypothetical protein
VSHPPIDGNSELLTGYSYGPAGRAIVASNLRSKIFHSRIAAEASLIDTVQTLIKEYTHTPDSNPNFVEFLVEADGTCIPFDDFIDFVAIPHTINLLIMQDYKSRGSSLSKANANRVRLESQEFGIAFNDDDGFVKFFLSKVFDLDPVGFVPHLEASIECT